MPRLYHAFLPFIIPLERADFLVDPRTLFVCPSLTLLSSKRWFLAAPSFRPTLEADLRTLHEVYNSAANLKL